MSRRAEAEKANELIASQKLKIKQLEHEVSTLRGRLDGLRKAKNTTITKKETEVVEVGFKKDPRYEAKLAELENQLREAEGQKRKEVEELKARIKELEKQIQERDGEKFREIEEIRRKYSAELTEAQKQRQKIERDMEELRKKLAQDTKGMELKLEQQAKSSKSGHEDEMRKLKTKISTLEADNTAHIAGNAKLSEKVKTLVHDLSVKETQWGEKEKQYKLEQAKTNKCGHEDEMRKMKTKISTLEADNTAHIAGHAKLSEKVKSLVNDLSVKETKLVEKEKQYKLEQAKPRPCGHEDEIRKMKMEISNLEEDNTAHIWDNAKLSEKINSLVHDLSVKEAKWCSKEEKFKLQINETEKKIRELQDTNNLLGTYLDKSGQHPPPNL